MGYVLLEVPEGVHLVTTTMIYEHEWKNNTKKDLKKLIEIKTEMAKENLLYALEDVERK